LSYDEQKAKSEAQATVLDYQVPPVLSQLAEAQQRNNDLKVAWDKLTGWEKDDDSSLFFFQVPRSRTAYYFKDTSQVLRVTHDIKDVNPDGDNSTDFPIALPKEFHKRILYYFHNSLWAMHMGWRKGIKLLRQRYYWYGMGADLRRHVERCLQCRRAKSAKPHRHGLTKLFLRTGPFEVVHVDFCGPFISEEENVNDEPRFVFSVIDSFSRWIHLIPTKDQNAKTAAEALVKNVISTHGCPCLIVSDNGPSFVAALWKELGKTLNITMSLTTPRHPQTNGAVERIHRVLGGAIRTVRKEDESWLSTLPYIEWAYRTTPISGIGLSPFQILYGRDPRMPTDIQFAVPNKFRRKMRTKEVMDYVAEVAVALNNAREWVREADIKEKARMNKIKNSGRRHVEFNVGDRVITYLPKHKNNIPRKRILQWSDVGTITKKVGDNAYKVKRDDKRSEITINVDRLVKVPKDTKIQEPEPDTENKLNGLFQMPEDLRAQQAALENKRHARELKEAKARRPAEQQPDGAASEAKQAMEALKDDIHERHWSTLRTHDLALHYDIDLKRWLPAKVLSLDDTSNSALVQYYWPRNDSNAIDNTTADWAPLWNNPRTGRQAAQWKAPAHYEAYTRECKRSALKFIGLQLHSYAKSPTARRRHQIHPVWWETIKEDEEIFREFAVA